MYLSGAGTLVVVGWLAYLARGHLLGRDLGTHWALVVAGVVVMGLGLGVERACRRHLSPRTLVGVPEVTQEPGGVLLEEGIYGRVRHPRYLGGILGLLATAMLANHPGTYWLAAAFLPAVYVVTWLEERELVVRFGERYRAYQRRVPRLIPRFGSGPAREGNGDVHTHGRSGEGRRHRGRRRR